MPDKYSATAVAEQTSMATVERDDTQTLERIQDSDIKKNPPFARDARYNLTRQESRLIHYAIAKSMVTQKKAFGRVVISVSQFCSLCGIKTNGQYKAIKAITDQLHKKSFDYTVRGEHGLEEVSTVSWVKKSSYFPRQGQIAIELNDALEDFYFYGSDKQYIKIPLQFVLKFRSSFSERLYSLLKSFEYKDEADFELVNFKLRLGLKAEQYPSFADLKKRVIDPAVNEINQYTDLTIRYRVVRGYRRLATGIVFSIKIKDEPQLQEVLQPEIPLIEDKWTDKDREELTRALLEDTQGALLDDGQLSFGGADLVFASEAITEIE